MVRPHSGIVFIVRPTKISQCAHRIAVRRSVSVSDIFNQARQFFTGSPDLTTGRKLRS